MLYWHINQQQQQQQQSEIRPRGYQTFFMLNSTEHEFFLLINVKMPTVVGILTFISRKNGTFPFLKPQPRLFQFTGIFLLQDKMYNHFLNLR